jgi:carboxypeptidase Taq
MEEEEYGALRRSMIRTADIQNAAAVLIWNQETHMPEKGAAFRGQQLATLSGMAHDAFTDPANADRVQRLKGTSTLTDEQARNVSRIDEDLEKASITSTEFVQKLSLARSEAFQAWQKAKEKDDFGIFAPELAGSDPLQRPARKARRTLRTGHGSEARSGTFHGIRQGKVRQALSHC